MSGPKSVKTAQYDHDHDRDLEEVLGDKEGIFQRTATFDYGPFVGKKGAPVEGLVKKVETELACEGGKTVIITSIGEKQAEGLADAFEAAGLRVKFEWDAKSRRATIWMADELHSAPLAMWLSREFSRIEEQLDEVCECGEQRLWMGADSKMKYRDNSTFHPDQSLTIQEGPLSTGYTRSPVVFESLNSQSLQDGQKKAKKIIETSKDDVHAVVLLNFEDRPHPNETEARCKVTLEVWRREATGDPAIDFPLDSCPWKDKDADLSDEWIPKDDNPICEANEDDHLANESSSSDEGDDDRSGDYEPNAEPDDESWLASEVTKVEEFPPTLEESPPADAVSARPGPLRPAVGPLVVFNEKNPNREGTAEYLTLDVYDFLRVCALDPEKRIPAEQRGIKVSLRWLRDSIIISLRNLRRTQGVKRPREKSTLVEQVRDDGNAASSQSPSTKRQRTNAGQESMEKGAQDQRKRHAEGRRK
ncbi:hypothetical protein FRC11_011065 [Ceratobasidium sp. 423]|nr:hypothetical protein FRC11_011065 [Ceratobasidium sp. 423]